MKNFDRTKTIQLVIYILLRACSLYVIFTDRQLYQLVGRDKSIRTLCILLWLSLGVSFLSVFIEFSMIANFKKEFRELDFVVHSDQISGIANRYSCDAIIEKYHDRQLPDSIACVMIDLTNIRDVNKTYGYLQGNTLIRDFSAILQKCATDICFVGRNGGNKFLAIFEDYSPEKMESFLDNVRLSVKLHNSGRQNYHIDYRYGTRAAADEKQVHLIVELIALANRRIYEKPAEADNL